ncbi:MAG: glycosyltransferase [Chloroflexota bacterium]
MTRLIYIANIRLPTEKAHGLQITQNCEAFADAGANVTLWTANRVNTDEMNAIDNVYAHYGVQRNFTIRQLPTLDLLPLVPDRTDAIARVIFYLQLLTFTLSAVVALLCTCADVIYSRTPLVLLAASLVTPRRKLVYEAHQRAVGRGGKRLQRLVIARCGTVVTITPRLRDDLLADAMEQYAARFIVAHDGVQRTRFANMPTQTEARVQLGWDVGAFIVGFVGRLHTLTQDKGIGTVIDALTQVPGASLALVGGPDDMAEAHRQHWLAHGLPPERFIYAGQVPPEAVPLHMAAFDVCVMPHPFTAHFAYHTSPLKLFEYMASGRAVVASDLPGWADVVRDGDNALLVPPSEVDAMAAALLRLHDDAALREKIGEAARTDALAHYTWDARAHTILAQVNRVLQSGETENRGEPMLRTLYRKLRAAFTRKITRDHLRQFLTSHATDELTLDVGAKQKPYADLFPNSVAGDIVLAFAADTAFDAHALPFPDDYFGVILCTEVLEHCIDPQQAINEFYRVLKPGGTLLLTTRFVFPLHDVPHDYFRFTRYGLAHLCRGFATVDIREEAATVETMAILLQRLGYQVAWKVPLLRFVTFALARVLADGDRWIATEYGEINRRNEVRAILASGYYVRAVKSE